MSYTSYHDCKANSEQEDGLSRMLAVQIQVHVEVRASPTGQNHGILCILEDNWRRLLQKCSDDSVLKKCWNVTAWTFEDKLISLIKHLQAWFVYRQLCLIHQCHYKANSEQEVGQQRALAVQEKVENNEWGSSQLAEPGRIQFSGTSWKMYPRRRLKVKEDYRNAQIVVYQRSAQMSQHGH